MRDGRNRKKSLQRLMKYNVFYEFCRPILVVQVTFSCLYVASSSSSLLLQPLVVSSSLLSSMWLCWWNAYHQIIKLICLRIVANHVHIFIFSQLQTPKVDRSKFHVSWQFISLMPSDYYYIWYDAFIIFFFPSFTRCCCWCWILYIY